MRVLICGGGDGSEIIGRVGVGCPGILCAAKEVGHEQDELCTCIFRELLSSSAAFPW